MRFPATAPVQRRCRRMQASCVGVFTHAGGTSRSKGYVTYRARALHKTRYAILPGTLVTHAIVLISQSVSVLVTDHTGSRLNNHCGFQSSPLRQLGPQTYSPGHTPWRIGPRHQHIPTQNGSRRTREMSIISTTQPLLAGISPGVVVSQCGGASPTQHESHILY
jgi:hypothetical protein